MTAGAATQLWRRARRLKRIPAGVRHRKCEKGIRLSRTQAGRGCKNRRVDEAGSAAGSGRHRQGIRAGRSAENNARTWPAAGFSSPGEIVAAGNSPRQTGLEDCAARIKGGCRDGIYLGEQRCSRHLGGSFSSAGTGRQTPLAHHRSAHGKGDHGTAAGTRAGPTAMQADSLATAISVLGHKDGMRLVSGGKNLGARVAYRDALGQVKEVANPVFRAWPRADVKSERQSKSPNCDRR